MVMGFVIPSKALWGSSTCSECNRGFEGWVSWAAHKSAQQKHRV